jgi:ribosomal protein L11
MISPALSFLLIRDFNKNPEQREPNTNQLGMFMMHQISSRTIDATSNHKIHNMQETTRIMLVLTHKRSYSTSVTLLQWTEYHREIVSSWSSPG